MKTTNDYAKWPAPAGRIPQLPTATAIELVEITVPKTARTHAWGLRWTLLILAGLLAAALPASAQTNWVLSGAPNTAFWYAVASSADGNTLAAAMYLNGSYQYGQIYISTNAGSTWTPTGSSNQWYHVACSANGQKLVATANYDGIYSSTNGGQTWISNNIARRWGPTACSSNGAVMLVAPANYNLSVSTNSGLSWLVLSNSPSTNWNFITCSADGTKMFGCGGLGDTGNPGFVFASTNSGATWTAIFTQPLYGGVTGVACSADGTKLAATGGDVGTVYTSSNSGETWITNDVTEAEGGLWTIASSADGTKLIVAGADSAGSPVYTSTDSGMTWTLDSTLQLYWLQVASSADGTKLAAASFYNTGIYTEQTSSATPMVPNLTIANPMPGNVMVSWPASGSYALQTNGNLATTNWAGYGGTVNTSGGTNSVTVAPPAGQLFFRLAP